MVTLSVFVTDLNEVAVSGIHCVWRNRTYGIEIEAYTKSSGKASCNYDYGIYDLYVNDPGYAPYNIDYGTVTFTDKTETVLYAYLRKRNFKVTLSLTP